MIDIGCDIHTMAEFETDRYVGPVEPGGSGTFVPSGQWKGIKNQVFLYPYFREDEPVSRTNEGYTSAPYSGRNYTLFSILADVRNERSTVNIFNPDMEYEERDSLLPLALPRGVPKDASKAWRKEVKRWGGDFHSHTWFTLAELIEFEAMGAFAQTIVQRGYVGLQDYLDYRNDGKEIESWSSYVGGGAVVSMHEKEWLALSDEQRQSFLDKLSEYRNSWGSPAYIRMQWEWNSAKAMTQFLEETIPALKVNAPFEWNPEYLALKTYDARQAFTGEQKVYDYNRIRIMVAFDN